MGKIVSKMIDGNDREYMHATDNNISNRKTSTDEANGTRDHPSPLDNNDFDALNHSDSEAATMLGTSKIQRTLLRKHTQTHFRPHFTPKLPIVLKRRRSGRQNVSIAGIPEAKRHEINQFDQFSDCQMQRMSVSSASSAYSDIEDEAKSACSNLNNNNQNSSESDMSSELDDIQDLDVVQVCDWLSEAVEDNEDSRTNSEYFTTASSVDHHSSCHSVVGSAMSAELDRNRSSKGLAQISNWLNEAHAHVAAASPPDDGNEEPEYDYLESDLTDFIRENMPIYAIMKQVQLFRNLSQKQQEQVLKVLKPAKFNDGQVIVQQGSRGDRFYMIAKGNAVVTKAIPDSKDERMITHLYPGHYFGELALIYDDPRTATVRAIGDVELLYLTQNDFQKIRHVHLTLMLRQVPLLARLNPSDQDIVLSRLQPANFNDGEYIVRQGDEGTRFYMITRGEAVVTEHDSQDKEKELTRLYEGHVFGEMSLIYKEPRTASVRAIGPVKCLFLTKEDFEQCLVSDHFQQFVQEEYVEKARRRAMRLRLQQEQKTIVKAAAAVVAAAEKLGHDVQDGVSDAKHFPTSHCVPAVEPNNKIVEPTETNTLVKQRLATGQKVVNKYVIQGDLGKGTYGRVKLCQNEEDNELYAVKIMHRSFVQRMAGKEDSLRDALRREIAIMKKLNHPNVVKLVEVIDDPSSSKIYLVQEYVHYSLMDQIQLRHGLTDQVARHYLRDLICGLHYLHAHKVIHRDIKPGNILITDDGIAKIADFGTARMIMNESETLFGAKGTPAFMAPEMFNIGAKYQGPSVDVWSLGATLYMMVIGHPPWLADNEIDLSEKVQRDELCFPPEVGASLDPHLKNLLQRMLTKDSTLRISLSECFTHEWVTNEGSEPLLCPHLAESVEQTLLTVSLDESELAIRNIPGHIDQSLSESLMKAHLLIRSRLQQHRQSSERSGLSRIGSSNQKMDANSSANSIRSAGVDYNNRPLSAPPGRRLSLGTEEDVSRLFGAWRHYHRVHLMSGHTNLSDKARELLLDQKRMTVSADRAMVSEIILPAKSAWNASDSFTSASSRRTSMDVFDAASSDCPRDSDNFVDVSSLHDAQSNERHPAHNSSLGSIQSLAENDADLMKRSLSRKKDFLMVTSEVFRDQDGDYQSRKILFQALDHDFSIASRVPIPSKPMHLSCLSTDGSLQTTKSSSTREGARHCGSNRSRSYKKSPNSSFRMRRESGSSNSSRSTNCQKFSHSGRSLLSSRGMEGRIHEESGKDIDLDGIEVTQIEFEDEEDEDVIMKSPEQSLSRNQSSTFSEMPINEPEYFPMHSASATFSHMNSMSHESDDSDYSDVDVDVDETFEELIGTSNNMELVLQEDEELTPLPTYSSANAESDAVARFLPSTIPGSTLLFHENRRLQVYVSSKIRENLILGIRSGYAEAKGSRAYMEDKTLVLASCGLDKYPCFVRDRYASLAFFGVFDGHNGDSTSVTLQQRLLDTILMQPNMETDPKEAIRNGCHVLDDDILREQNSTWQPKLRSNSEPKSEGDCPMVKVEDESCTGTQCINPISFSGSATVFALLVKEHADDLDEASIPTKLYVGNVGDCRAVLAHRDGTVTELTCDHKASNPDEKARIAASGGFVHNDRLDGILAISRGFGDLAHKQDGHLIADPDVYEREVSCEDEFLLLASDGLFDVISSQRAANFIQRKLRLHGDVQLAAQELLLKAQHYFSHDNKSAVIIAFHQTAA